MWNRRDWIMTVAAAATTFGLTLAAFYPTLANAVNEAPVTATIAVPTLKVGAVEITAQLDKKNPHLVLLTARNTGAAAASAKFIAQARVYGPTSPLARGPASFTTPWSQDLIVELQPGQTKTLEVTPPDKVFEVADAPPSKPSPFALVPGRSELFLSANGQGFAMPGINTLTLARGKAAEAPAGAVKSAP